MPLQATSGAASYDAFGGGAAAVPQYIEDVFSTWLYTGNGSTQTINNGIDLAGKGGLVWIKARTSSFISGTHLLQDSVRGFGDSTALSSNLTNAQYSSTGIIQSVSSTGFTTGNSELSNGNTSQYASWTFREQPKFFDVVTWTGDGTGSRSISHALNALPGCIIAKRTDTAATWQVFHRSLATDEFLALNTTAAAVSNSVVFGTNGNTTTTFSVGAFLNGNGQTYVAYLFAHNAGGFGLTGTDNVITCGSFTTDGSSNATVDLGYEPQWMLAKRNEAGEPWVIADNLRGWTVAGTFPRLEPNSSSAEANTPSWFGPTATGFRTFGNIGANKTYIYIAIRRGPMKVPTTGTSVFSPISSNASNGAPLTTGFPVDMQIQRWLAGSGDQFVIDRLRGVSTDPNTQQGNHLSTNSTAAEASTSLLSKGWNNTQFLIPGIWANTQTLYLSFRRAPGFFDEVCYTGTGSARTVAHNLTVAPELMIIKSRLTAISWAVYYGNKQLAYLESSAAGFEPSPTVWNDTAPTSTVFSVGSAEPVNQSGNAYVAYLFASCLGVSKVGTYTGNGSSQTINCGFTGGARFVMIKRTNASGDWYVWDTARGIVAGNDPHISLNTTAAQVTSNDTLDTNSTGFVVNQVAATNVNVNAATYIFLAIA